MGQKVSRTDFEWTTNEDPHASRRKMILEKYPQIKKLFGVDPQFKYNVSGCVLIQFIMLYVMKGQSWPVTLLVAYCFGAVINHALTMALHEVSHSRAYGYARPVANKWFGFFCNLPLGFPVYNGIKKYHPEHHRNLSTDNIDVDLPTLVEAKLFCTSLGKFLFICLQPIFYIVRPGIIYPKPFTLLDLQNLLIQLAFDTLVVYFCGWRVLGYMVFGTLMGLSFHPVSGHVISEHYMFAKGFETYSYYGPLNYVTFNTGYHIEHHDFPSIPYSRLPEVKSIAAEFYDNMPQHHSWIKVQYDFIMDPAIGPFARFKRKQKGLDS